MRNLQGRNKYCLSCGMWMKMFIMCFHGYGDSTTLGNASRAHRWSQMNVSQVHHGLSEGIKMRQIDRLGRDCMNIESNMCELAKPSEPRSMCHATCICAQKHVTEVWACVSDTDSYQSVDIEMMVKSQWAWKMNIKWQQMQDSMLQRRYQQIYEVHRTLFFC